MATSCSTDRTSPACPGAVRRMQAQDQDHLPGWASSCYRPRTVSGKRGVRPRGDRLSAAGDPAERSIACSRSRFGLTAVEAGSRPALRSRAAAGSRPPPLVHATRASIIADEPTRNPRPAVDPLGRSCRLLLRINELLGVTVLMATGTTPKYVRPTLRKRVVALEEGRVISATRSVAPTTARTDQPWPRSCTSASVGRGRASGGIAVSLDGHRHDGC